MTIDQYAEAKTLRESVDAVKQFTASMEEYVAKYCGVNERYNSPTRWYEVDLGQRILNAIEECKAEAVKQLEDRFEKI